MNKLILPLLIFILASCHSASVEPPMVIYDTVIKIETPAVTPQPTPEPLRLIDLAEAVKRQLPQEEVDKIKSMLPGGFMEELCNEGVTDIPNRITITNSKVVYKMGIGPAYTKHQIDSAIKYWSKLGKQLK